MVLSRNTGHLHPLVAGRGAHPDQIRAMLRVAASGGRLPWLLNRRHRHFKAG